MDPQLLIVLSTLAIIVVLIITEVVRIDVVALLAMLSLVWTGSISANEARSGFASNAVLAIIGVMVMGRGLYKSGITETIAQFILRVAGNGTRRILSMVSVTVGLLSAFIQNIGAAALFLPVMMGISKRENISISSLLMPMGFAALLGGTLTMVGTSSLIVLNDLLSTRGLETFGLFAVTPIGVVLLLTGIVYFFVFGDAVLPSQPEEKSTISPGQKLLNIWGLSDSIFTFRVPRDSALVGQSVEESKMGAIYSVNLLRVYDDEAADYNIWEDYTFESGQHIVVQGPKDDVWSFAEKNGLDLLEEDEKSVPEGRDGYLEVVVPARSSLVGKTIREVPLREQYNAQVVLFFSNSEVVEENLADRVIRAGDTLVLQGKWDSLQFFKESGDFITVTPFEYEPKHPEKAWLALGSFVGAILAVLTLDLPISIGFLTGAVAMVLGGVLTIEEAYRSVEWKVIFLIAGLIPIGIAMETSGAAAFIAENLVTLIAGVPAYGILFILGVLMTIFSLIMSNVAATVLMIPLVLEMAGIGGLSAQALVLQVGLCAANSFILPTHHVNALLMTPGGYRVSDYLKAGSLLSLLFVTVSTTVLYFFYV
ncbi:SLC13 family permease [Longibacter salinarum]|uniref:SLC13 family permease n=1 Tax=Longibacter salinarum TaxID=1850348 RepID=A0A2A8D1Q0_9BACT|nr:SLC13 family permease [Longibacter salinarum]PEN14810.1 SLC13 family permease [Longibacter salinarum]